MAPLSGTSCLCRAAPALPSSRFYCGMFIPGKNPLPVPNSPSSVFRAQPWLLGAPGARGCARTIVFWGGFLKSGASPPHRPNFRNVISAFARGVPGSVGAEGQRELLRAAGTELFWGSRAPHWLLRQPHKEFNPKFLPQRCFPIKRTK